MNVKQQAAQDLLRLAKMFSGIVALADDLNQAGSLDQSADETKARIADLGRQEQDARASLSGVKRDLAAAVAAATAEKKKIESALAERKAAVEKEAAELGARAQAVLAEAEARAEKLAADARNTAASIIEKAKAAVAGHEAKIAEHGSKIEALAQTISERQAKLDQVNAAIANLRNKL